MRAPFVAAGKSGVRSVTASRSRSQPRICAPSGSGTRTARAGSVLPAAGPSTRARTSGSSARSVTGRAGSAFASRMPKRAGNFARGG